MLATTFEHGSFTIKRVATYKNTIVLSYLGVSFLPTDLKASFEACLCVSMANIDTAKMYCSSPYMPLRNGDGGDNDIALWHPYQRVLKGWSCLMYT